MSPHFTGLIAAVPTPFGEDGSLHLGAVTGVVDHLAGTGVTAIFVCGSTGESTSLTIAERKETATAYAEAARGKLRVIIHVGHNSLREARDLAAHAQKAGAEAIAAAPPSYFKPESAEILAACCQEIATAVPELPFFYYHIPRLTGIAFKAVDFLQAVGERFPNLAGVKFACENLMDFQQCLARERFQMLFGCDEILLSALAVGAQGAVGSTYCVTAPLYRKLWDAFDQGNLEAARVLQAQAASMVAVYHRYGGLPAIKASMNLLGLNVGPCRLPLRTPSPAAGKALEKDLRALGFFAWQGAKS